MKKKLCCGTVILFFFTLAILLTGNAETLILPQNIQHIDAYAFAGCTNFTGNLRIPYGVKIIGAHAFDGCTGLSGKVILPETVTDVDETAFINTGLEVIPYEEYDPGINMTYDVIDNGTAIRITKVHLDSFTGYEVITDLMIPSHIDGLPVVEIGENAGGRYYMNGHGYEFAGSLTLPDTIRKIDSFAFQHNPNLTSVRLPAQLEWMGEQAFTDCPKLSGKVYIPRSVRHWESLVFSGTQVEEIWSHFVYDYEVEEGEAHLISLFGRGDGSEAIPEELDGYPVTVLCDYFNEEAHVEGTLVLPSSVRRIGACVNNLEDIRMNEGLRTIGSFAFHNCDFPKGDPKIPQSVRSIEDDAFYKNTGITSLVLPERLENLGHDAFRECFNLRGDLVIPDGVREIMENAFLLCGLDGGLKLPKNLTHIHTAAFYGTPLRGPLILPDSLEYIGNHAFMYTDLEGELILPEKLEIIGNKAFYSTCLEGTVYVPESVTYVGTGAFDSYYTLEPVYKRERSFGIILDIGLDDEYQPCYVIKGCNELPTDHLVLPEEYKGLPVKTIDLNAFHNHVNITGPLVIPDGYESIEARAFAGCTGLTGELFIPSSVIMIKDNAFSGCTGLTGTLILEDHVILNADGVFSGTNLTVIQNGSVIYQPDHSSGEDP